nr:MAG TPA: hypothetical protein [Caudoviricetes sp.]
MVKHGLRAILRAKISHVFITPMAYGLLAKTMTLVYTILRTANHGHGAILHLLQSVQFIMLTVCGSLVLVLVTTVYIILRTVKHGLRAISQLVCSNRFITPTAYGLRVVAMCFIPQTAKYGRKATFITSHRTLISGLFTMPMEFGLLLMVGIKVYTIP